MRVIWTDYFSEESGVLCCRSQVPKRLPFFKGGEGIEGEGEPGLINGYSINCYGFSRMMKRRVI
jgi:hypothetical protein